MEKSKVLNKYETIQNHNRSTRFGSMCLLGLLWASGFLWVFFWAWSTRALYIIEVKDNIVVEHTQHTLSVQHQEGSWLADKILAMGSHGQKHDGGGPVPQTKSAAEGANMKG